MNETNSLKNSNSASRRDKLLLYRISNKDCTALSELFDIYSPSIYGSIVKQVSNPQTASSILQEIFLDFYQRGYSLVMQKNGSVLIYLLQSVNKAVTKLFNNTKQELYTNQPTTSTVYNSIAS